MTHQGAALLGCVTCGGVWLDNRACQSLVRGSSEALLALADRAARNATTTPAEREARCPVCSSALGRTVVPPTAVTIDTCAAHGTWFDPNELRTVALAYARKEPPRALEVPSETSSEPERRWFSSGSDGDDSGWLGFAFDVVVGVLSAVVESSDSGNKT